MTMKDAIPPKNKQQIVIKFLTAKECAAADIHQRLGAVYGENNVTSLRTIKRWQKRCVEGCTSVDDEDRADSQSDTMNEMV